MTETETTAEADEALRALLDHLRDRGYRFVTPTPATHARVLARPDRREGRSLTGILGWSLPFAPDALDPVTLALLRRADAVRPAPAGRLRSTLRVSTLHDRLYLHSAYPTDAEDAVFFGPDSYRFADLIAAEIAADGCPAAGRIVDIGAGAGVGAITAAGLCPDSTAIMTDINAKALRLTAINAAAAGIAARAVLGDDLEGVEGPIDLALANPPYIIDDAGRDYRDGGGMHGGQVALDMARMALPRLAPGGRLILYTGSAIIDGTDRLEAALAGAAEEAGCRLRYREIDPDVFGEELEKPQYREVDRIALVAAVVTRG